jgi:hypothetical protein
MLDFYVLFCINVGEHLHVEIDIRFQVLHLRALVGVKDIFQDERVDGETFPELFNDPGIPEPIDVNPGHGLSIPEREAFGNLVDHFLSIMRSIIIYDRDPDRLC